MTSADLLALIRKNPVISGCAVLCMLLGLSYYFRSDLVQETENELAQRTTEADRYALNGKNAIQLKEQLEALVAANKEVDSRIVRAGQLGLNHQYFYKVFGETGVKQIDLRQTGLATVAKGAKNVYVPVGFSVSVQGEYPQILRFLRHLESGARYCRVLAATCNAPGGDRGGLLTLSLNLELLGQP
jgi:hypothetical protein